MTRYHIEAATTEQTHAWEADLVPFLHAQQTPDAFLAFGSRNTWTPVPRRLVEIVTDDKATSDRVCRALSAHPLIAYHDHWTA